MNFFWLLNILLKISSVSQIEYTNLVEPTARRIYYLKSVVFAVAVSTDLQIPSLKFFPLFMLHNLKGRHLIDDATVPTCAAMTNVEAAQHVVAESRVAPEL